MIAVETRVGRGRPDLDANSGTERWTISTSRTLAEDARVAATSRVPSVFWS